jgi:NNP family nitrate/nitrite transporter-like MFS transporter
MEETASSQPSRNGAMPLTRALPHLLLLTLIFFAAFLARIVLAPLLPGIQSELPMDHSTAGSLFFILSTGYFVSLLSTGYLAACFTHRRLIMSACFGLGLALLATAGTESVRGLQGSAFMLGLAAGLYLPSGISAVTHLTMPQHWGRALAIHELAPNLSFVLAPVAAEVMLRHGGWRFGLALMGGAAMLLGLIYAVYGRGTGFRGAMPDRKAARHLLGQRYLWLLIAIFGFGIASTMGTYTMLPLYLVDRHGMDHGSANALLAASRLAALPMAFAGGWMADRFGPRATIRSVFLLSGTATTALGLLTAGWLRAAVFGQPLLAVCFFPAGFSALSALSPPGYRNIMVALIIPAAFLVGGGAVPLAIGWLGDGGYFAEAFTLTGILITLGAGLTLLLPRTDGRL